MNQQHDPPLNLFKLFWSIIFFSNIKYIFYLNAFNIFFIFTFYFI